MIIAWIRHGMSSIIVNVFSPQSSEGGGVGDSEVMSVEKGFRCGTSLSKGFNVGGTVKVVITVKMWFGKMF